MDFHDCRSMRVILVPHCALNQNARLARCAELPACVKELIEGLLDRQIGILQMPCPELLVIGLDRERIQIRSGLESRPARDALRQMARELVYQIDQYRRCGVQVVGVLGKNGSPSCGVEQTSHASGPAPGKGAFIEELSMELTEQGIDVPLLGTMDDAPQAALKIVDDWLDQA